MLSNILEIFIVYRKRVSLSPSFKRYTLKWPSTDWSQYAPGLHLASMQTANWQAKAGRQKKKNRTKLIYELVGMWDAIDLQLRESIEWAFLKFCNALKY